MAGGIGAGGSGISVGGGSGLISPTFDDLVELH